MLSADGRYLSELRTRSRSGDAMLYLSSLCFFTVIAHAHALGDTATHHLAVLLTGFSVLNHAKFYDRDYAGKTFVRRADQICATIAWFRGAATCWSALQIFSDQRTADAIAVAEWFVGVATLYYALWVYHIGKKTDDRDRGHMRWHLSLHGAMMAKSHALLDLKSRLGLLEPWPPCAPANVWS
jgi:hypothetical protein